MILTTDSQRKKYLLLFTPVVAMILVLIGCHHPVS